MNMTWYIYERESKSFPRRAISFPTIQVYTITHHFLKWCKTRTNMTWYTCENESNLFLKEKAIHFRDERSSFQRPQVYTTTFHFLKWWKEYDEYDMIYMWKRKQFISERESDSFPKGAISFPTTSGIHYTNLFLKVINIMRWLRLIGSLKTLVSFAKERYKRDDILHDISYFRCISCHMTWYACAIWKQFIWKTSSSCNTLQHVATHCNTLQHTATRCNTLQHVATHGNTLQHIATRCNTLQHVATHGNTL